MLGKTRRIVAAAVLVMATLLFVDFTGAAGDRFWWLAKIQLLPAFLAANFAIVAALLVLTLIFGRLYCSAVCPLGIFQDVVWRIGRGKKRMHKMSYSPEIKWLRYGVFALFASALLFGAGAFVALLAPYSSYGRIAEELFAPVWRLANNALAAGSELFGNYLFAYEQVWTGGGAVFAAALASFALIVALAYKKGRLYCNSLCPVGTLLGFFSRYSIFSLVINLEKCNGCGVCARNCKSSCINSKEHKIDLSRCVACFDCIDNCRQGAITYSFRRAKPAGRAADKSAPKGRGAEAQNSASALEAKPAERREEGRSARFRGEAGVSRGRIRGGAPSSGARRGFFALFAALFANSLKAQVMKLDGGLAELKKRELPRRAVPVLPPGSVSAEHMAARCTACQLCVSSCPTGALAASSALSTFMQPHFTFERGHCRIDCVKCSQVCPTGAILKIDVEDKASIQAGRAVWIAANCVVNVDKLQCDNCYRHCPAGAIHMVLQNPKDPKSLKIPAINEERCIGCGACEHLCPARPFTAIYVEGNKMQRRI